MSIVNNAGNLFSVNKFYNNAKSQGYRVGKDLLYEYANHIEDAFLAFSIHLFDKSIRRVQTNPKKQYVIDPGLARALTFEYEKDFGRLFKNVVYLDLRRQGCQVNYYITSDRYEIDFFAQSPQGTRKFFQVAWLIDAQDTAEREHRALEAGIKEQGIDGEVVTLDSYLRNGISF